MFFGYFLNTKKVTPSADFVIGPAKAGVFLFSHTRLPLSPRPLLPFGRISLRPLGGRPLRGHGFAAPHRHFPLPAAAAPTTVSGCCFLTNMNRKHNIQPEIWYNNLKPAACAAARSSCADALSRMDLRTLNHAKPQHMRFCRGRFAAPWYNNLKSAACAAARSSCADALSRMDLRTLNHAKPQ